MNSKTYRFSNRSRLSTALLIGAGAVLGLLAACSSDGGNPSPSKPPVISTGGGGHGGAGEGEAGENSEGGSTVKGGSGNNGGRSNGGSGGRVVEDEGGAGGEAGEGPIVANCPDSDLGFLNQPSSSQKSPFDNAKRLGAAATLPVLP
ncbi:MAG TPA: hypothetical protein VHM25_13765 [Polyangiaceae bacterium]|jgi:hypothetical protein|nr:hypothetical protein [Polyangiaceae bacterium]